MMVSFAFQVRSLQGLVKLETELARRTTLTRHEQVKQLKSEKLSPCSRANLEDSNACASTTLPKTGTVLILLPEINDFLQNRQLSSRSISLCFSLRRSKTRLISR